MENKLEALGFQVQDLIEWKGNGQDYQGETSKTEQRDYIKWQGDHSFVFIVRDTKWYWRMYEKSEWQLDQHWSIHANDCYYPKVEAPVPLNYLLKDIKQVKTIFKALTGESL